MRSDALWKMDKNTLVWNVLPDQCHSDSYEMSGLHCDCIIEYGVDARGGLVLARSCYFPMLRTIPNDTHGTLEVRPEAGDLPELLCDGVRVHEFPRQFTLDGTLIVRSITDSGVEITRRFLPAAETKCSLEVVTITAERPVTLTVSGDPRRVIGRTLGTKGVYIHRVDHCAPRHVSLQAGESCTYTVWTSAWIANETPAFPVAGEELRRRCDRIEALCDRSLVLDTGIPELDQMVRFAKLRAGESIFETLSGKFHSPGGRTYYAAVWCNDQVEYAGPHFAMTGDKIAVEASLNAYRAYVPFMADDYRPIPSSVIAEGLDIWNGAGDRGDAAMYLYGASAFCLYLGNEDIARELYGPIQWCAEYCLRRESAEGVICSESDELEGRIPTDGYANLSTSALCYGGLMLAAKLADSLGDGETACDYRQRADRLGRAIEDYFGAELHGFHTYRYSRGFDTLRSWICLPVCMGLTDRTNDTVDAMLSPLLWTEEGMLSCELSAENTNRTIWDRSTLYGFKAAFLCGCGSRIMGPLLDYCRKRLLCDRVPYAVEAYPEGEKRHLSGESALFVRVVTEGLLGITPESLTAFSFVPELPDGMPHICLSGLYIVGGCWEIRVEPQRWQVSRDGRVIADGVTDGKRVCIEC